MHAGLRHRVERLQSVLLVRTALLIPTRLTRRPHPSHGSSTARTDQYTQALSYYTSVSDTRACSACGCGTPSGVACTLKGHVGVGLTCTAAPAVVADIKPGCIDLNGVARYGFQVVAVATQGGCTPSGGKPTGTATPAAPVTVCCMP